MSTQPPVKKRKIRVGTVLLVLLAIAVTLFCTFNRLPIQVWPFGWTLPLYGVILISLAFGIGFGWLAKGVLGGRRSLAPDNREEVLERNAR